MALVSALRPGMMSAALGEEGALADQAQVLSASASTPFLLWMLSAGDHQSPSDVLLVIDKAVQLK